MCYGSAIAEEEAKEYAQLVGGTMAAVDWVEKTGGKNGRLFNSRAGLRTKVTVWPWSCYSSWA